MNTTSPSTRVWNQRLFPHAGGNGKKQRTVRPYSRQLDAKPVGRRFNRVTIGFWLGGLTLAIAGCILGACMPYSRPVAVSISILWWGIYLGCLGASIGAGIGGLLGLRWGRAPASSVSFSSRCS
jgi:hypothetical protein